MQTFSYFNSNGLVPVQNSIIEISLDNPDIPIGAVNNLIYLQSFEAITQSGLVWSYPFSSVIKLTGTNIQTINEIFLPDATLSPGASTIFLNQSNYPVKIIDFAGNFLNDVDPSTGWAYYNTDSSTQAGQWSQVLFGSTNTSANATDLAGYGLSVINSKLNIYNQVITTPSVFPDPIPIDYAFKQIVYTGPSDIQILPASPNVGNGFSFFISNQSSTNGLLVLQPASGTIDGQVTKSLGVGDGAFIFTDGVNYFSVGFPLNVSNLSADLAGYGLTAFNNKLNIFNAILPFSSPLPSIPESYAFKQLVYTGTAATQTLNSQTDGFSIFIKNISNTADSLILQPDTGLIDNKTAITLQFDDGVFIFTDGTNWYSIGLGEGSGNSVYVGNGSAAAPSISFTEYKTTGFFTEGNDDVAFSSNGTAILDLIDSGVNILGANPSITYYEQETPLHYLQMVYPN